MNSINKLFSTLLLTVMLTSSQGLLQIAPATASVATTASASKPLNTLKSRPLTKAHPNTGVKPLPPDDKTLAELQKAYRFLKQGQAPKSAQALKKR